MDEPGKEELSDLPDIPAHKGGTQEF